MGKIIVFISLTLDGVMQAPGRSDEDRRGGFTHGGWAIPYSTMETTDGNMAGTRALLFGRRTYEDFYTVWPGRTDNPFTEILDNTQKYVASTTLKEPLPWKNSTLIKDNVVETVARLREEPDQNLLILGSGVLVRSLMQHNLIDEYTLLIHPLVLGSGRHLFTEGSPFAALQLISSRTTTNGIIIATYWPASLPSSPTSDEATS